MKKLALLSVSLLAFLITPVYADICPAAVSIIRGHIIITNSEFTTLGTLPENVTITLPFSSASYNYYQHKQHSDGRISCDYTNQDGSVQVELITRTTNLPEPKENRSTNKWEPIFEHGDACTWPDELDPSQCPFNS